MDFLRRPALATLNFWAGRKCREVLLNFHRQQYWNSVSVCLFALSLRSASRCRRCRRHGRRRRRRCCRRRRLVVVVVAAIARAAAKALAVAGRASLARLGRCHILNGFRLYSKTHCMRRVQGWRRFAAPTRFPDTTHALSQLGGRGRPAGWLVWTASHRLGQPAG